MNKYAQLSVRTGLDNSLTSQLDQLYSLMFFRQIFRVSNIKFDSFEVGLLYLEQYQDTQYYGAINSSWQFCVNEFWMVTHLSQKKEHEPKIYIIAILSNFSWDGNTIWRKN